MCLCSVDWPAFFGVVKDLALAAAAVITATVAVRGLQKWREELRGKADFDVARGLARATYRVRDELAAFRSPLMRGVEYPPGYEPPPPGHPSNPTAEANKLAYAYNERWKHVTAALRDFDAQRLEAEALWGSEIRKDAEALHRCATIVFVAVESILDDAKAGGKHFEADREFGLRTRAQAHASPTATDNPTSNQIADAVSTIERRVSVHLKRDAIVPRA